MGDYLKKLQQVAQQSGNRGGFNPKPPPGSAGIAASLVLLVGGGLFFNNALFNVDGGHRAIKYKRLSGVSKEIYNEGKSGLTGLRARISSLLPLTLTVANRNTFQDSMV